MVRSVLGVIGGSLAWTMVWLASETILSAIFPEGYGVHQVAFERALLDGGEFTANTGLLRAR